MPATTFNPINFPPAPYNAPYVWHDAGTLRQRRVDHPVPAGMFADWQHDAWRAFVYELRELRPQPTHAQIAEHYRFQHWIRNYNACNCESVRRRTNATPYRQNDHRLFARRRATIDRTYRTWGVELEYEHMNGRTSRYAVGQAILDVASQLERSIYLRSGDPALWNGYHDTDHARWSLTHDGTVAGEVVSPVGFSDRAFDDMRTVMAAMRSAGAQGAYNQGLHTNIGTGDLDHDGRVRLVENLSLADRMLQRYTPRTRHQHGYSHSYDAATWASIIDTVRRGATPYNRGSYNFAHMTGSASSARIEFRQYGHSMNFTKLKVWVQVCRALVTATANGHSMTAADAATPGAFTAWLRTHGALSTWAATRFVERATRTRQAAAA